MGQNLGSLRLGDSEPEEMAFEDDEPTAEYEGVYDDEDDDEEGIDGADADAGFEARAAAIRAYDEAEEEASEADADQPVAGFRVVWSEPDDDGTIYLTISGQVAANVQSEQRGERTIYTSAEFKGEQTSLKAALTSIGRNVAARSVASAWDRANPKQRREAKPRSRTSAKSQEIEALNNRVASMEGNITELLSLLRGGSAAQNGAASEQTAKVRLGGN